MNSTSLFGNVTDTLIEGSGIDKALFGDTNEPTKVSDPKSSLTGTNLEDFLNRFSRDNEPFTSIIDPLQTFDVSFVFFPNTLKKQDGTPKIENQGTGLNQASGQTNSNSNSGWSFDKVVDTATSIGKNIVDTATNMGVSMVNNLTSNLLGNNGGTNSADQTSSNLSAETVLNQQINFAKKYSSNMAENNKRVEVTFIEYLANSHFLIGSDNWLADGNKAQSFNPLELQLGFYIQEITIPSIKNLNGSKYETYLGEFSLPGKFVVPDKNVLTFTIINTKASLHERIFYPWLREVSLPYWAYKEQPYTTATITVDFTKHNSLKYIFTGCRPISIDSLQASQGIDAEVTRKVEILFDYMIVSSNLDTIEFPKPVETDESDGLSFDNIMSLVKNGQNLVNTALGSLGKY